MRTIFLKTLVIAQAFVLTGTLSFAGNVNGKTDADTSKRFIPQDKCLEVIVRPVENNKALGGTTIKIYMDNEPVSVINTEITPLKKIMLDRNKHYTVEVSKKGYYSKLVSISTILPSDIELEMGFVYEYFLEIELIKEKSGVETYYTDFPIALISYNYAADNFIYSRKYTSGIIRKLRKELGTGFTASHKR